LENDLVLFAKTADFFEHEQIFNYNTVCIGTIPAMILMISAGQLLKPSFRIKFKKMVPVISLIIGVLLVLRGLNLNIPFISPYVSPNLSGNTAIDCH